MADTSKPGLNCCSGVRRHFFMKLFLAAPASFLSFALAAHSAFSGVAPASAWHFFMKLFLAAPASFFRRHGSAIVSGINGAGGKSDEQQSDQFLHCGCPLG
jgi:hypothetical protein